jgi:hypothetical protein
MHAIVFLLQKSTGCQFKHEQNISERKKLRESIRTLPQLEKNSTFVLPFDTTVKQQTDMTSCLLLVGSGFKHKIKHLAFFFPSFLIFFLIQTIKGKREITVGLLFYT